MVKSKATFAGGCFWGVEARLGEIPGVLSTVVGYAGGSLEQPTYQDVCTGETDHAEAVQVVFDSSRLSYDSLLDQFFALHDPTQLNRQGPDTGRQYRSAIFVHDEQQRYEAVAKIAELNAAGVFHKAIVTTIEPAAGFWKAEEHHQHYLEKRGMVACHI